MSDTTEITKPKSLEEAVRAKIRSALFDAIPDEQIDGLIQKQWADFFEPTRRNTGSGAWPKWEDVPSRFAQLVTAEISEQIKPLISASVRAELAKLEIAHEDGEAVVKGELVNAIVKAAAPTMIEAFFAEMVGGVLQAIQERRF